MIEVFTTVPDVPAFCIRVLYEVFKPEDGKASVYFLFDMNYYLDNG
jgi:hypothetical protein